MAEKPRTALGRYELLVPIGHAGGAQIHLARLRGAAKFEKLVIVRIVDRGSAGLLDEARRAALIKHPGVIDIADVGDAEGRYFIATEDLDGATLRAIVDRGRTGKRIDELDAARVIADAAEGLDAAHELRSATGEAAGFPHGHVTLDSIVVQASGQVKIADFGATGDRAPTVAPELADGKQPTRHTDYFALGVVMWEALTHEVLQGIETRYASEINANIPAAFDDILAKAMARDPQDRYATGKDLANDIEDVLSQAGYSRRNDRIAAYMTQAFDDRIAARRQVMQDLAAGKTSAAAIVETAFGVTAGASAPAKPTSLPPPTRAKPASTAPAPASTAPAAKPAETQLGIPPTPTEPPPTKPAAKPAAMTQVGLPPSPIELAAVVPPSPPAATRAPTADPIAVVSLPAPPPPGSPGASGEHDVLSRWAWQTGSQTPIVDDDDDYHQPEQNRRTLIYLIGAGVAAAAIVAVIAFAFGGKKTPKRADQPPPAASTQEPQTAAIPPTEPPPEPTPAPPAPPEPAPADPVPAPVAAIAEPTADAAPAAVAAAAIEPPAPTPAPAPAPVVEPPPKVAADPPPSPPKAEPRKDPPKVASEPKKKKAEPRKDPAKVRAPSGPIDPYADAGTPAKPTAADAERAYRNGIQQFARGDTGGALESLRTSQAGNPGHAPTQRALGMVYEKMGKTAKARAAFKRYLQLAPRAGDAAVIRGRMERL